MNDEAKRNRLLAESNARRGKSKSLRERAAKQKVASQMNVAIAALYLKSIEAKHEKLNELMLEGRKLRQDSPLPMSQLRPKQRRT